MGTSPLVSECVWPGRRRHSQSCTVSIRMPESTLLLVHIGDIHIENAENPILSRVEQIIIGIRTQRLNVSDCFIIVPGDIAYSGRSNEYALAESFFLDLIAQLHQEFPTVVPQIVFVPGSRSQRQLRAPRLRKCLCANAGNSAQRPGGKWLWRKRHDGPKSMVRWSRCRQLRRNPNAGSARRA